MLDIPEEGYELPVSIINTLYNKYFAPKYDWIDRFDFDEFKIERTESYVTSEKRRKKSGPEEFNPTMVIHEKTPEIIKASGKIYTKLSKDDLANWDNFVSAVGEKEANSFSTEITNRPDFMIYTPLRNSHYNAFSDGDFNLKLLPNENDTQQTDNATITESKETKTKSLEILANKILPEIYPVITDIKIKGPMKRYIGLTVTNNFYKIEVYTTIPEDVTRENYWDSEYGDMDFTYMNDYHIKDLLKYLSINPDYFHSEIVVYDINGNTIGEF